MYLLFNNQLIPEDEMLFYRHNRALQYNDGFFETIMVIQGAIRFWPYHQDRIRAAAAALHLDLPPELLHSDFPERLLHLASQNNALHFARLKLKIWRSGAGLYTPETNKADWVATANPASAPASSPLSVGICTHVSTCNSPFSFFKGPNALLYVMAGIEKKEQEKDDMLLLDGQGFVAELISSSIFWKNGTTVFTPALETGCIKGIMRTHVLHWAQQQGLRVEEVKREPEVLQEAELVFSGNVTGLRLIDKINDKPLETNELWLQQLKESLT
ncbi:aminotransferase class IV [Pontibacter qinzhouensis]|uniref:branched-chain-amino-acid transaminase n=1 Tax=Pontibacter qinzhouensis TaxID=2603253 RepID=A0A5C8K985_9BACT|nr:aminotransferase class IV [Pontibacter qinzhouensis]TXK47652.1 aminotransferase class IV [Pontibacter qinzhouensis]